MRSNSNASVEQTTYVCLFSTTYKINAILTQTPLYSKSNKSRLFHLLPPSAEFAPHIGEQNSSAKHERSAHPMQSAERIPKIKNRDEQAHELPQRNNQRHRQRAELGSEHVDGANAHVSKHEHLGSKAERARSLSENREKQKIPQNGQFVLRERHLHRFYNEALRSFFRE